MRPLNLGETLDASIKIVRSRWKTLATVMVVIALPIQLANIIIIKLTTDVYQIGTSFSSTAETATTYSDEGAYVAGQTAMIALSVLGYLLGIVACYRAVADTYLGRETSARASLSYAAERLGATLWLTIVLVLGLLAGFLALFLPGIWLYIAWAVVYPVMLVEGTGGVAALKRSFQLVQTRWWATAGRMAVSFILVGVATVVATLLFLAPTELFINDTSFGALILEHAANLVVSLVTTPFVAAVTTLVYFDLRVRKEGFDPALLGEGMGGPPARPAAHPRRRPRRRSRRRCGRRSARAAGMPLAGRWLRTANRRRTPRPWRPRRQTRLTVPRLRRAHGRHLWRPSPSGHRRRTSDRLGPSAPSSARDSSATRESVGVRQLMVSMTACVTRCAMCAYLAHRQLVGLIRREARHGRRLERREREPFGDRICDQLVVADIGRQRSRPRAQHELFIEFDLHAIGGHAPRG